MTQPLLISLPKTPDDEENLLKVLIVASFMLLVGLVLSSSGCV